MYTAIINNLHEDSKIKTVIVTMNLRSFSAYTYYSSTYNSINQRLILLDKNYPPLINRFFLSFQKAKTYNSNQLQENKIINYKNKILEDAPYTSLYNWSNAFDKKQITSFDYSQPRDLQEKAKGYITNYAFQINKKKNPMIKAFDKIVTLSKAKKIKLVFHFLPENIKECNSLISLDLASIINKNRNMLIKRYSDNDIIIVDNLELLDNPDFIENIPNSHYYYNARRLMAKEISKHLTSINK
jgi:hypothetical protein